MYRGLVIGGPLDGQMLEHSSNMYRIEREPGTWEVVYRIDGTRAAVQPHQYYQYLFNTRYWMPYTYGQGARPITDVLDVLDATYIAAKLAEQREGNSNG